MKLQEFCERVFSLTHIPFSVYDRKNRIIQGFQHFGLPLELEEHLKENRQSLLSFIDTEKTLELTDEFSLSFFAFRTMNLHFVFGPFLIQEASQNTINSLKEKMRLIGEKGQMIDHMYHDLLLLSPHDVEFIYNMVRTMFQSDYKRVPVKSIQTKQKTVQKEPLKTSMKDTLDYVRKNYKAEDKFIHIIETGDVKKAEKFPVESIMTSLPERALHDTLRNTKTKLTILNTICNRAAIRAGISIQLGHQISTNFGITIEKMKSIFDNASLQKEIIISYSKAVHDYALTNHSKLIKEAILLIRRNITSNYNLQELARDLYVTKEHLSRQFKTETTLTVSSYIKKAKIIEAKGLLSNTTQSIMNISNMLGFSNSSHFSKVFDQWEDMSPLQYRKHNQKN